MAPGTATAKYIFLDVVAYSHGRTVEAQSEIINALNTAVIAAVQRIELPAHNLIFLPTGDGLCIAIIDLLHPYDVHIQLALNILENIFVYNSKCSDNSRSFEVRVGLNENVDNVVTDINGKRNVAGEGINIAQRVMSVADGKQIIVSSETHSRLAQRDAYAGKFAAFLATFKRGLRREVFQYTEKDLPYLSVDRPTAFVASPEPVKPREALGRLQAYYVALAIRYSDFLYSQYRETRDTYCFRVALYTLARYFVDLEDKARISKPILCMPQTSKSLAENIKAISSLPSHFLRDYSDLIGSNYLHKREVRELFEDFDLLKVRSIALERLNELLPEVVSTSLTAPDPDVPLASVLRIYGHEQ